MLRVTQQDDKNIFEVQTDGHVTPEDFDLTLKELELAIETFGKIRLIKIIGDLEMPPIPMSKFWDDIKFGFEHLRDITHIAVVADQSWIGSYTNFMNPLFKAEMQTFKLSELETARVWIENAE